MKLPAYCQVQERNFARKIPMHMSVKRKDNSMSYIKHFVCEDKPQGLTNKQPNNQTLAGMAEGLRVYNKR